MSYPLEVLRGSRLSLRFDNQDELQRWLADEEAAWSWLSDGDWMAQPQHSADRTLAERVMELQCPALEELKALASGTVTPTILLEALTRGYGVEARALCRSDPGAAEIIDAARQQPAFALGMLAQALNVPVESESAASYAGRQAWFNQSTAALAAAIPARLADLDEQFSKARERLARREIKAATVDLLAELKNARMRNAVWVVVLVIFTIGWITAASYGLYNIHDLTNPPREAAFQQCLSPAALPTWAGNGAQCVATTETRSAWGWPQWSERFALYVFLMTAFTWGMRWLGRMINDAWNAGQSAARRWVTLSVVLADETRRLVSDSEKDKERIRNEVFGDKESEGKPVTDKEDKEEDFSVEQLGKLTEVMKKLKEIVVKD